MGDAGARTTIPWPSTFVDLALGVTAYPGAQIGPRIVLAVGIAFAP